ncbi:hypothetical protein MPH_07256 [Macrophomina phaseolina MS6]|uniref:Uncharacterized protein n=1 Tax=Macrophomina phaseolina (strain MS6) TaxID=1126212 RepID=K2QZS9_MACPH|nr:hypothetical protein MPH_07256 [Macrophomina phaseolina MS6]
MKCVVPMATQAIASSGIDVVERMVPTAVEMPDVTSGVVGVLKCARTPRVGVSCWVGSRATASVLVPGWCGQSLIIILSLTSDVHTYADVPRWCDAAHLGLLSSSRSVAVSLVAAKLLSEQKGAGVAYILEMLPASRCRSVQPKFVKVMSRQAQDVTLSQALSAMGAGRSGNSRGARLGPRRRRHHPTLTQSHVCNARGQSKQSVVHVGLPGHANAESLLSIGRPAGFNGGDAEPTLITTTNTIILDENAGK